MAASTTSSDSAGGRSWARPLCDQVLVAGSPRGLEYDAVKETLLGVSGVKGTHDLHLWALTLSHHAVSVHVAVGECPASSCSTRGMGGGPTGHRCWSTHQC